MLEVWLLGKFEIRLDGVPVHLSSRSEQSLLAYLLLNAGTAYRREKLAGLFWPESDESNARAYLRLALWHIRKAFKDLSPHSSDFFVTDKLTIAFNSELEYWSDVAVLKQGDGQSIQGLVEATSVYQGELLPGFYDEWVVLERESLRTVFERKMYTLVERLLSERRWQEAIKQTERWISLGETPEPAYRGLMIAHAGLGEVPAAIAAYQRCVEALKKDLDIQPSAETRALYEKIRSGQEIYPALRSRSIHGFELREKIGEGSYGAVYRAFQPAVGREVAVKVILPQYANEPEFIRHFETEAQIVARLEHPRIMPLYDYWRGPDGAYLVMRLLKGGSLETLLDTGPVELARAVDLVDQIASALALAHQHGVIHRDIKPTNILFDEAGNAYLSDFGIAKVVGGDGLQTQASGLFGTPVYMSPEQILGQPVTPQSDIYSLGIILFQLLTGEAPFHDEALPALIEKHLHQPLPSARHRRPDLPEEVDRVIQRATVKDPARRYPDALTLAATFRQALSTTIGLVPVSMAPVIGVINPYKGLRAFQEADAADFFGREAMLARLVARLGQGGPAARFLAVVGPSGSGKSSLVKAGLIPALRRGALPGSEKWLVVEMIPGSHPFEELEISLLRIASNPAVSLLEHLRRDERGLLRASRLALPSEDSQLLLVIDQFEEIFTLAEDEAEARQFMENLYVAVCEPRSPLRVVISLRADFFDRPLMNKDLSTLLQDRTELVVPLSVEELERAIRSPAHRVGVEIEPSLVTAMVAEVVEQPGALPLLQFALTELFEWRQDQRLTLESYRAIGGVEGVLDQRAEDVFSGLSEAEKTTARQVFLRLVTLGEGVEDTRRRVLRSELEALGDIPLSPSPSPLQGIGDRGQGVVEPVLDAFGKARLLSFDRDAATRSPTVEIAHEALLREWRRLRGWLDDSRADVRLQRTLGNAAAEWIKADRDDSFLLRGSRLDKFESWTEHTDLALTSEERLFLEASLADRQDRRLAEAARQRREAALEQRARNFLRGLVAVFALAAIVAMLLSLIAFYQRDLAQENFVTAERVRMAAQAQIALDNGEGGDLPALLSLRSLQLGYSPEADASLLNALTRGFTRQRFLGHTDSIYSVKFSPDGRYVATASLDATARLWNVQTGQEIRRFAPPVRIVHEVEFSPDGRYLLTCSPGTDGARLWDVQTGQEVRQFIGHKGGPWDVEISPDGQYAVTGDDDIAHLWKTQTGQELRQFIGHKGAIPSVAFSPDGRYISTGGADGTARLWDIATGQEVTQFSHDIDVNNVQFSPDGQSLLTVSGNIAQLWDIPTGQEIRRFVGHTDWVTYADFSPDGRYVLTGSLDKTVRLWNATNGQELRKFIGHTGGVATVAFSPDGRYVLTGSDDRTARMWDVSPDAEPRRIGTVGGESGAFASAQATALSPDSQYMLNFLTGEERGEGLTVWNTQTGDRRDLKPEISTVIFTISAFAFSPDNRYLLGGGDDGVVWLWDAQTGQLLRQLLGHSKPVRSVTFSPDGRFLLTGSDDQTARLWDAKSSQELRQFAGHSGSIRAMAFSPDGQLVLTSSDDQTARLWDAKSGQELRQFAGHSGPIRAIAFSPDGQFVLTGSDDQTARLWEAETGKMARSFIGHTAQLSQVAFSPDGRTVLTGSADQTARLWDVQTGQQLRQFVGHLSDVLYAGFLADGRYVITGDTQSAITWRTALDATIAFACAHLTRDLTPEERALYNIADNTPTCDEFAARRIEVEPTWTPIRIEP